VPERFEHELEQIKVVLAQTLFLLFSRFLLFWALWLVRWNHKNASLSNNDGYTGFRPNAGRGHSRILESLYWQHACLRYQYRRRLTLVRYRSWNRPL
jgi:hypothetical protein